MAKDNDVRITIRVPKEVKEWLEQKAELKDVSVSYLVRRALEDYMEKR